MWPYYDERLDSIPWADYQTAYGPAVKVPDQLRQLAGVSEKSALGASHDLWCGLCHQYAYVSSAALPALPFILEVLDGASEQMTIEIFDILCGFAHCTIPGFEESPPAWVAGLRAALLAEKPRLERLAAHANEEIADFAKRILLRLDLSRLEDLRDWRWPQ